ncbi:MAG: M56 family metallopeptidase [Pedobacter sp.]|nr:MAG: M56 family metallopeptidase [Pedobacter sp.]
MSILYYLLEVNLYILLSYGLYKLWYQKETFYTHNRYYLILSTLFAFIFPFIQIGWLNPQTLPSFTIFPEQVTPISYNFNFLTWIFGAYLLISIFLLAILIAKVRKLITLAKYAEYGEDKSYKIVFIPEEKVAYSFFNTLYIHPQLIQESSVLEHEKVHIYQKHSIDVLFFEILQIVCWFNPIVYLLKNEIKLIHEYLADANCTKNENRKHAYAMFLIENSFRVQTASLSNQLFNQSLLRNRIIMLNKKKTTGFARFRILLSFPLAMLMLVASTKAFSKNYALIEIFPKQKTLDIPVQDVKPQDPKKAKKNQVKFPPPIVKPDAKKVPPPPVDPSDANKKKNQVKFPPPIIKPDAKEVPPPPVAPKNNK